MEQASLLYIKDDWMSIDIFGQYPDVIPNSFSLQELLLITYDKHKPQILSLKDGDVIKLHCNDTIQWFYLHKNVFLIITMENNYILPSMAWKHVQKYGKKYYKQCNSGYIFLPPHIKVKICDADTEYQEKDYISLPLSLAISINNVPDKEYLLVDNIKYQFRKGECYSN